MVARLAIHRLSARTPARAQPVAARLALQALGADLEDAVPGSLPPQALLWLRRLRLQAPETVLLRPAPGAWRQGWIAAGREQLDAALAQAARPALGPVPDSAPAVLFADAAEMLACLALAAQRGQLDRWWWRGLLGRAWPRWQPAWAARPEAQAAAQRLLARVGQGRPVGTPGDELLPAPDAVVTVQPSPRAGDVAVAAQREPVVPADARHEPTRPLPPARPGAASATYRGAFAVTPREPHVPALAPPAVVAGVEARGAPPEAPLQPRPRVRARLADPPARQQPTATPAANASQVEASAAPAWEPSDGPTPAAPPRGTSPRGRARIPARDAPASVAPEAAPSRADAPLLAQREPPRATPSWSPAGAQAGASPRVTPAPLEPATSAERIDPPAPVPHSPSLPSQPAVDTAALWPWPQALASHQAPLLFIVNALLEDGLYPDFTRPLDPGLPVPPWALLAALARAWRLPGDPLQAALQQRCPGWAPPRDMPAAPGAPAGPWPAWLAAYARALRRRLCRRLGCRPAAWPQALTLARPARLWLSEAEWVAEFSLDSHDVAWRLAGLDRDPGWLPAAGCSLRFEFV
ncbi:hypothetical protein ACG04Q_24925 [Roseateles sp. DXS20W]|uniref:Uncharacterized protein n=1 Tax=Pelomonas lactea TaxID=3299030 RepID=A0ABW7GSD7_9BURK